MKIKDEAEWQKQCAEFAADPNPMAVQFQQFVETWALLAEDILETRPGWNQPVEALRETLRRAEEQADRWPVGFLGQALLVLNSHWELAGTDDEFYNALTSIEQNLFLDVAAAWLIDRGVKAEEAVSNDGKCKR